MKRIETENGIEYLGSERSTDFGYFGQIILGLKNQAWFLDNATTWLLCSNDDADDPNIFNEEDLLKHYEDSCIHKPLLRLGSYKPITFR